MTTPLFTNPDAPTVKLVKIGNGKSHHLTRTFEGVANELTFCGKVWTATETDSDTDRCKRCAKAWDKLTAEFWANESAESVEVVENRRVASVSPESDENLDSESTPSLIGCFVVFNDTEFKIIDQTPDQVVGGGFPNDWLTMQALDGTGRVSIQVRDIERDNLTVTPVATRPVVKAFPPLKPRPTAPATPKPLVTTETPLTLSEFLAANNVKPTPRPRPSDRSLPKPRAPFTPADLDALNQRRRLGSEVLLHGGPRRFARLASVLPRVGDNPPAVMVEFSNGHTARYALGDVLLAG